MFSPLSAGWLRTLSGRVAVRHLPHQLAAVEIDGREHAVRRLHDRQSLDVQTAAGARAGSAGGAADRPVERAGEPGLSLTCGASAALPNPGPSFNRNCWPGDARDVANIGESLAAARRGRAARRRRWPPARRRCAFPDRNAAPGQFVPPPSVPIVIAASGPSTLLTTAGRNIGPIRYLFTILERLRAHLGREVNQIVDGDRPGARRRAAWSGTAASATSSRPARRTAARAVSSIGQTGWPVTRSKTYRKASLLGSATALIGAPSTVMSTRIGAEERS